MNLMVSKEDIESIFGPEYDRIRDVAQSLSSLEDDGDREIFLLAHTFSNVAAPIMGNIQLRRSFATVIEICDHAIDRIKHPEETLDGHPVQTVHSVHFMELRRVFKHSRFHQEKGYGQQKIFRTYELKR